MKKFFAAICAAALLLTGCGGGEKVAYKPANNFSAAERKLGMMTRLNTDEEKMGTVLDEAAEKFGVKGTKHLPKFYDSLKLMQLGIMSGEIQAISTYRSVADYLVATNSAIISVSPCAKTKPPLKLTSTKRLTK